MLRMAEHTVQAMYMYMCMLREGKHKEGGLVDMKEVPECGGFNGAWRQGCSEITGAYGVGYAGCCSTSNRDDISSTGTVQLNLANTTSLEDFGDLAVNPSSSCKAVSASKLQEVCV